MERGQRCGKALPCVRAAHEAQAAFHGTQRAHPQMVSAGRTVLSLLSQYRVLSARSALVSPTLPASGGVQWPKGWALLESCTCTHASIDGASRNCDYTPANHFTRSEERRVGKECRERWEPYEEK